MALDGTYAGLQASVADWLVRSDLTTQIQDFIKLGEEDINKYLRVRAMQVSAQITASAVGVTLPTDWLEYRSLTHTIAPFLPLTVVGEQWANEHDYQTSYYNDPPLRYTIEGSKLSLATKNAGSWILDTTYYQKLDIANGNASSLAVLAKYPSLYLFSALSMAIPFLGADDRAGSWVNAYSNAQKAVTDDNRAKYSGSTLVQRVRRAP